MGLNEKAIHAHAEELAKAAADIREDDNLSKLIKFGFEALGLLACCERQYSQPRSATSSFGQNVLIIANRLVNPGDFALCGHRLCAFVIDKEDKTPHNTCDRMGRQLYSSYTVRLTEPERILVKQLTSFNVSKQSTEDRNKIAAHIFDCIQKQLQTHPSRVMPDLLAVFATGYHWEKMPLRGTFFDLVLAGRLNEGCKLDALRGANRIIKIVLAASHDSCGRLLSP